MNIGDMRIGIVGGGVVGRATARTFLEHVKEVRVYDVVKERSTHNFDDTIGRWDSSVDLVFLCLPTPQEQNSLGCYLGHVDDVCGELSRIQAKGNYVLRSTVPIGTTRRLREKYNLPNLVHSPEFLTARCAVEDAHLPARNVIGEPDWKGDGPFRSVCANHLVRLYNLRFPGVPVYPLSSDESEAVKLMQNSFFAVKVAFWNECRALADKMGLDWNSLLPAILADGRIGSSHTKVPGPDGKRGFGGTCLPKDLANLIQCIQDTGLRAPLCAAAHSRNQLMDRYEHSLEMQQAIAIGERIERQILGTPLSQEKTWERLKERNDGMTVDAQLSIREAMASDIPFTQE